MSDEIDCTVIDEKFQKQIETQAKELEKVKLDKTKIGDPQKLVDSVSQIVWEQFVIQIAGQAGKNFVSDNHDLNLSLKKADHYLNSDSFVKGKIPSHNFDNAEKYQERYKEWDAQFKDRGHEHLAKDYREPFDANRAKGNSQYSMDHTIPVKEFIKDKQAATYMSQDEKVAFANDTNINLKPLDREANASKGDKPMKDWLASKRVDAMHPEGATPDQRFNIDKAELEKRDDKARTGWEEAKQKAQARAEQEGKASVRSEALKAADYTAQAMAIALLAKLTRTVFQELISWLGDEDRKVETFFEHLKKAVIDFLTDFKNNVLLSIDVGVTTLLAQIFGEIVVMIRKAFLFLKIGGKTVIEVTQYLKDPQNKGKESSVIIMDVGKIVTVGLTTASGIGLGMAITTALERSVPALATPIPLLGSPASLLGIFFGGLTSGICGAIVLQKINCSLTNMAISENYSKQLMIQNDILFLQNNQLGVYEAKINKTAHESFTHIRDDMHKAVEEMGAMKESLNESRKTKNDDTLDALSLLADEIE